ncbi:MAG: hypothetical protein F6K55_10060 [Moorea sp. SIO4A3]|nr:hypothetical protein [Moorena sp. SIO4A3]
MSLLGNIIWLIFGGLVVGTGYIIGGLAMQRGLGEAARSWGFPPLALCRGFPHSRFASRQGFV